VRRKKRGTPVSLSLTILLRVRQERGKKSSADRPLAMRLLLYRVQDGRRCRRQKKGKNNFQAAAGQANVYLKGGKKKKGKSRLISAHDRHPRTGFCAD